MTTRTPLLLLGDAPSCTSGLGRILRDIAVRIATDLSDTYRVATFGYGGHGAKDLPFFQYAIEGMDNWFLPTLPDVWEDFAEGQKGIVLTIWDPSRLLWLARPDNASWCPDPRMRKFLLTHPFKKFGYFALDALGPHGRLSRMLKETMQGYDRVLAYSEWAKRMIRSSFDAEQRIKMDIDQLAHGIDTSVFYPQLPSPSIFEQIGFKGRPLARDEKVIGIVATNQARKDWGLAIEAIAQLDPSLHVRIFIQTDVLERHWSIPALLMDFGLLDKAIVNGVPVSDDIMAQIYSTCDLTLGIGAGEGFGYPTFESLACGTPHLTGNYGGHAEHLPDEFMIEPVAWRWEGPYNSERPVHDPKRWAYRIAKAVRQQKRGHSLLPAHLDWRHLWARWKSWLLPEDSHDSRPKTDTAESSQSKT